VINFVSNLPKDLRSGGGFRNECRGILCKSTGSQPRATLDQSTLPAILWQKALSKFRRVAGSRVAFFSAVAGAMNWMPEPANEYQQMREAAWAKARG
jgi:hypothetical protein